MRRRSFIGAISGLLAAPFVGLSIDRRKKGGVVDPSPIVTTTSVMSHGVFRCSGDICRGDLVTFDGAGAVRRASAREIVHGHVEHVDDRTASVRLLSPDGYGLA